MPSTNLKALYEFCQFLRQCPFSGPECDPEFHIVFSCCISFVSINLGQFFSLVCHLFCFTFWKNAGQLFCRMSFNLDLSGVISWLDTRLYIFGENATEVLLWVSYQRVYEVSFYSPLLLSFIFLAKLIPFYNLLPDLT